ncbi:MAG: AtpZ/AtpI family protein [Actinobacteria bacterium]|nr:AtpZ/AtpI family protein [Actinomycetota bacterium]
MPDGKEQGPGPDFSVLLGMGITVAACVALGVGLGLVADAHWHTGPLWTLVGLGAGVCLAAFAVYGEFRKYLS